MSVSGSGPQAVSASGRAGPGLLLGIALVAVALPLVSSALSLFDRVQHWGKLVHGVEGLCVALLFGLLLLGWRDREAVDLTDQLSALTAIFAGILFGVLWEIVEFIVDWVRYSDIQKSNSDTMTDFLWNDLAAVAGALLAARLYCHWASPRQRQQLGGIAAWLVDGPSRLLDRHGFLLTIVVAAVVAASVAALWFAGRPVPGFPTG